jgi:hypothetical protein
MELHLKIVGSLLIALALMHLGIPRYFKWKEEVAPLSAITRQILYVHTFFVGFVVLLMGILCLRYAHELVYEPFGRIITLGLAIFWLTRLFFQFFVYSPEVWRGKAFETAMHGVFSVLWFYFGGVFFFSYLQGA